LSFITKSQVQSRNHQESYQPQADFFNPSTLQQPFNPSTLQQPFNPSIRQALNPSTLLPFKPFEPFNPSTLPPINPSTLASVKPSTLQSFNPSTLQHFPINPSTLQPFNSSIRQPGHTAPRAMLAPRHPQLWNQVLRLAHGPFNPSIRQTLNPSTVQPFNPSSLQHFNPSTSKPSTLQNVHLREQNLAVIPNWCTFVVDTVVSPNGGRPSNRIADKGRSAPPCFEHVVHSEPAKQIDGVEARLIVEQVEADLIQQCMTQGTGGRDDESQYGRDYGRPMSSCR
jgi:hypothetical protein